jgi:hypothetical protein
VLKQRVLLCTLNADWDIIEAHGALEVFFQCCPRSELQVTEVEEEQPKEREQNDEQNENRKKLRSRADMDVVSEGGNACLGKKGHRFVLRQKEARKAKVSSLRVNGSRY